MPTVPTQMRLTEDTLADLDAVARLLHEQDARKENRSEAVRFAARLARRTLEKKLKKSGEST